MNHLLNDTALESINKRSDDTTIQPENGFNDLGIAPILLKGINKLNFSTPTPVQIDAIPVAIRGDDIIGIAQTGSGKTIAFGIPMLQRLSEMKKGLGLILVPTRELAIQVEESLRSFSRSVNIRSAVLIGGASLNLQRDALRKNPRVIIATPGRLMDHIERKTVNLALVEVFILDEADRMLDMGFIPDIKKIMQSIPDKRQTMLFSATMPREIEAIAEKLMENPSRIEIDRSGATPAEISHEMFYINNQDKSKLLAVQLEQCSGPVLVFTRTKRMAHKLTGKVKNMGFAAAEIHSDRSLEQRRNALEGFKRGRYQILIATDIAARGIDVAGIELVVNYDMPANSEDYVHRIGRTGRAGNIGHAVSFATTDQRSSVRNLERFMHTKLTIGALPTLPNEEVFVNSGERPDFNRESSRSEYSQRRRPSMARPSSKRSSYKSGDSNGSSAKRNESRPKGFKSKDIDPRESNRKASKPQRTRTSEFGRGEFGSDNSFRSGFKKKRPSKKKSVGQGSGKRKRTRRG